MRAYEESYSSWYCRVDDEYDKLSSKPFTLVLWQGPVFPFFLEADFSSYENFRDFTNRFGLAGLACFHPPIQELLSKRKQALLTSGKIHPISKRDMQEFWQSVKDKMQNEQELMYTLLRTFVDDFPQVPALKEQKIDKRNFKELIEHINQYLVFQCKILLPNFADVGKFKDFARTYGQERYEYPSIISRSYREVIHLIQDERGVKRCKNCQNIFVTDKLNENYCNRIAPEKINEYFKLLAKATKPYAQLEDLLKEPDMDTWKRILANIDKKQLENLTCKKVGPYKVWKEELKEKCPERFAFVEEKKRRLARLYYLRDKKKQAEYQKAKGDFDRWVKENQPAKEKKDR